MCAHPVRLLSVAVLLAAALCPARPVFAQHAEPVIYAGDGHTVHGDWHAEASLFRDTWRPGQSLRYEVTLRLSDTHLASMAAAGIKADRLCALITAERTFDADGWQRLASDERMSTLMTPAGLAIEGGVQGAVTTRYGYPFKSPLDAFVVLPARLLEPGDAPGTVLARFAGFATLPADLPPGLYRLRFDFGVMAGTRLYNINGFAFAARPFSNEAGTSSYYYSPIIPASGTHVSGREVDAAAIQARFPWLLLAGYNSNGYRGVIADEDRHRFAMSDRNLIPDEVILPMVDDNGARIAYSLEPQFPTSSIDALQNIAFDWSAGAWSVKIHGPDGSVVDLGTQKFVAKLGYGPTTKAGAFTAWKPLRYGRHTVIATGWIADSEGRRYEGGGTYRFWVAKRMTLATATFQGQPYPIGSSYGRDIQFNPAVPADVEVTARLFVNSDPAQVRTLTYAGKASPAGLFGAPQGMKPFPLNAAGEYHASVLATYTDADGHLWVSTMRHAGIVYPPQSPIVARGKKFAVGGKYVERGETKFEGYVGEDGEPHLAHITFPYLAGDMILIGSEGQGANKLEPVLTYQTAGDTAPWDTRLNGVGTTNLRIRTSNGYSPHLYPEYITDIEYYYGAAPRPGFMGRFLVGESNVRAPYWPVSPNSFGGQIGASANGDAPGDIYRLIGGVVLRRRGQDPMYAGYIASAFILPKGSNNNRVVAPGSEDLIGATGERARFFLVGLRPGTAFETGASFRPALQIDPLLPVSITFTLLYPDGRQQVATGVSDTYGSFAGPAAWPLDVPGVYRYRVRGTWNGHEGRMPGLPDSGGYFFVYSKTRPAGASGIRLEGSAHRTFSPTAGATVSGTTAASKVYFTLLTPGAVIDQGELPVTNGRFQYRFDPAAAHARAPIYDIVNNTTGKPQIGRVIHLTFFAEERTPGGAPFFDVVRVVLRGTTLLAARVIVAANVPISSTVESAWGQALAEARARLDVLPGLNRLAVTDTEGLRTWDATIDRMEREGALVVTSRETDPFLPDRTHERLQQRHDGVPVFGATLTRQVHRGVTVSIFGSLHAGIGIGVDPGIGPAAARAAVARRLGGSAGTIGAPSLVVLPLDAGGYALAWQVEARTGADVRECFIDAMSGAVLLDYSNLKRQTAPAVASGVGAFGDVRTFGVSHRGGSAVAVDARKPAAVTTFDLRGDAARAAAIMAGLETPGGADVARPQAGTWSDSVVVDAHTNVDAARGFFERRFGRRGLDGRNGPIDTLVHPARLEAWPRLASTYPHFFGGAVWDGRYLLLGEGLPDGAAPDGRARRPASAAFDVIVHELTHAVIDSSSSLVYRGESAALAEAFADIMATAAEFATQPAGDGRQRADYLIGEDAVAGGERSLADPVSRGGRIHAAPPAAADEGRRDPHIDSTMVSHVYYLAVEGGVHATSGLAVDGVGHLNRELVERVFYRAWIYLLPSSAGFTTARAATQQSARDLCGEGSAVERAIDQAWRAVGVR